MLKSKKKPENVRSIEIGTRYLRNKFNFDFNVY
jgi:hypothetical protein